MTRRRGIPGRFHWRLLALVAAINLSAGVGMLSAQTVIVKGAKVGSTIDLVVNATAAGSATADASGFTTIVAGQGASGKPQIDALVYVDQCGDRHKVLILERGRDTPPLEEGCDRQEITGLFVVRPTSTLVVDVSTGSPSLLLRQGRFDPTKGPRAWSASPDGLVVFGGGTYARFKNASASTCGDVSSCTSHDSGFGYTAGAAFWFLPYLAAEGTYVKPKNLTASGSGSKYTFNSSTDLDVLTVAGLVGVPLGPARIFGKAGATYHHALFSTTETIDDTTVTVDGVEQTFPGGTQTLEFETGGWSWMFGGGVELWFTRIVGVYSEVEWLSLKGKDLNGGEGVMDEKVFQVLLGGRLHIGR